MIFGTSNEMGAQGVLTTASGTASITTGTTSASSGAKDAGAVTVINSVSGAGHTHTVNQAMCAANYIIKT